MQTLPEVTPRKEPTEITGSLFAVAVVIPLNYPRANQCARPILKIYRNIIIDKLNFTHKRRVWG